MKISAERKFILYTSTWLFVAFSLIGLVNGLGRVSFILGGAVALFTITDNPATAARLCHSQGLLRSKLDDMEPADAQALYFATAPQQPDQREGAA